MQQLVVERQPGRGPPCRSAWRARVRRRRARASSVPAARARSRAAHARARALGVDVDDRQALGAEPQERERDRGARAARAEQDDVLQRGVRQAAREVLRRSPCVGVVPADGVAVEDDGVDRLQRLRVGREGVEVRDDGLLARMGDVEAREAGARARTRHERGRRRASSMSMSRSGSRAPARPLRAHAAQGSAMPRSRSDQTRPDVPRDLNQQCTNWTLIPRSAVCQTCAEFGSMTSPPAAAAGRPVCWRVTTARGAGPRARRAHRPDRAGHRRAGRGGARRLRPARAARAWSTRTATSTRHSSAASGCRTRRRHARGPDRNDRRRRGELGIPNVDRIVALLERMVAAGTTTCAATPTSTPRSGCAASRRCARRRGGSTDGSTSSRSRSRSTACSPTRARPSCSSEALRRGVETIGGIDPAGVDRDPVRHLDVVFGLAARYGARDRPAPARRRRARRLGARADRRPDPRRGPRRPRHGQPRLRLQPGRRGTRSG